MHIFNAVVFISWLTLLFYWTISAFNTKRYARRGSAHWIVRACMVAGIVVLAIIVQKSHVHVPDLSARYPLLAALGAILCVLGVGIAIWARAYLGRNWGMPMTLKENPELVTTGPYAYVRHPIYSGVILGMLGTALATNAYWLFITVVAFTYFIYSARFEERLMRTQFGEAYILYMKRTKMLIPFIF